MKATIWIGCFLFLGVILGLIRSSGFVLGGIPTALMFGGMWCFARFLTKKQDEHKSPKNIDEEKKDGE